MCDKINAREPPLTRLPPELLALVFESLDKEERTLCLMSCWGWLVLIKSLWPELENDPDDLMFCAAEIGSIPLMRFTKKWGATHFSWVLYGAARNDHVECMKLAKEWGATDFEQPLESTACRGHIECLKLLKKWGKFCTTDFDKAL